LAVSADSFRELTDFLLAEQRQDVAPEAHVLSDEIRRRHGDAVDAVLFYGSCLRRSYVDGGVLDFYVVVDSYRRAYRSRLLALANDILPPNVFYVDLPVEGRSLRMKYNVISRRDFAAACRPESLHSIVWARFCQPSALLHVRDESLRRGLAEDAAEATMTMLGRMLALHPGARTVEALWQAGFATTYTTEFRPETSDTIATVYQAVPERYARVTALAVDAMRSRGLVEGSIDGEKVEVGMDEATRHAIVASWRRKVPVAKALYALRLLKTAATFGDWLPYALWKLTRHTGVVVELTERQRRHPLVFGWPVIFRLVRGRTLR